MTTKASTGISEGRVGRYLLEDLVAESRVGTQFWRASDPALGRAVGARLIPIDDPRVPRLREAARAAARVHHRPIVQVLDVVETGQFLAVITEWVVGRAWAELASGSEDGDGSAVIAYEVARALQACHAMGVTHGRLRPSSVMITDTHEVRVRGLQIDAAMYGVAPGDDPVAADIYGVGAVLFAGLTGRWPDPLHGSGTLDGLPIIGPAGNRLPTASELVAGVSPELSRIAGACLAAPDPRQQRRRFTTLDQAVGALGDALLRGPAAGLPEPARTRRRGLFSWLASAVVAGILVAMGALAVQIMLGGPGGPDVSQVPTATSSAAAVGPVSQPQPLTIAAVTDFDPQGNDGEENRDLVGFAIDGNPDSAWLTVPYRSSGMDPKDGTGLVLDLGLQRPIREVQLSMVGAGTDVELRISDAGGNQPADYELLAAAVGVGPELTIRTPTPVVTRYVLVWFTNLPYADGSYQGGIRQIQILG